MVKRSLGSNKPRLIWIDLEMTGLDENNCRIIEAAMIITDLRLVELASFDTTIWQPDSHLETMAPVVRDIHTKNGLLEKVRKSKISLAEAEHHIMEILTGHVNFHCGYLAGNTIYMDRIFLRKYMPLVERYLHYRMLDVSSFKIVAQSWFGAKGTAPKVQANHTALSDIQGSIDELKFYQQSCFRPMITE